MPQSSQQPQAQKKSTIEALLPNPRLKEKHCLIYGILNFLFALIIIICVILFVGNLWNTIDSLTGYNAPFFGLRASVVISPSMSFVNEANKDELEGYDNQIQVNDLVLSDNDFTFDSLQFGDIILYNDDGTLICHRLVDKFVDDETGEEMVVTRGDANTAIDTPTSIDNVVGVVYSIVPGIGEAVRFLQSPYGLLGICAVVFCATAGVLVTGKLNDSKEKKDLGKANEEVKEKFEPNLPTGTESVSRSIVIASKADVKPDEFEPF